MSQFSSTGEAPLFGPENRGGPTESASHTEHQAALDATVFQGDAARRELVLELEAGELRLRRTR